MSAQRSEHKGNTSGSEGRESPHVNINVSSQDTSANNSTKQRTDRGQVLLTEIGKLKNRARAFAGAFVGMVSPVLLAIVLKKTNLKGVGKYQGTRILEVVFNSSFQGVFPHLAAATLQMGMMPFLFVMISEACATFLSRHTYIAERVLTASKFVVFFSNILLMFLGCGVLIFIHTKNAWFSWLVVSECFTVAAFAILLHVCSCYWWYRYRPDDQNNDAAGGNDANYKDYHSKLEHSLEFSAGITAMMFLVLGSVVLEGLLRSSQLPLPPAPAPVMTTTTKETGAFLAATLLVSFFTSAFAALLMNVWTIPLVVLTGACVMSFNIALATLATVVVILITWEELQLTAWWTLLPPFIVLLVLLARFTVGEDASVRRPDGQTVPPPEETKTTAPPPPPPDGQTQRPEPPPPLPPEEEETKPAPLELTKVMFTGLLAVAVPGVTTASPGIANNVFVFCAAATVLLGILWRLLTHAEARCPDVRKAVNHSSFLAQAFLFCAGIAVWVMAVNAPN